MDLFFTIHTEEERVDYGRFAIEPLEQGYGHTLGAALRRVLLTSLRGSAITTIKIDKVKHPFSTMQGVKEDVIEFLLNLKKVRIKYDGKSSVSLELDEKGSGEVKAGDIKTTAVVEIVNPDQHLATLSKEAKLSADLTVETGTGFSPADERKSNVVGVIPVDAIFSPVTRVNYKIEQTRVGRVTNYDKLILELWTDGTISPIDCIKKSAEILVGYFNQIINPQVVAQDETPREMPKISPAIASLSVEELNIPARIANALVRGGYETVGQLLSADPVELAKVRNLGEKSVKVISAALGEHRIEFPTG
ncbi:DNA-directed RNA polymerase subunit alpha [Candidatus Microgenomates bacterium]|nr:DNA-directed RNA polymerase subunit alpha [Candidatus Microgenomates bacterium]